MSGFAEAQPAGFPGAGRRNDGWRWPAQGSGPPVPLVILAGIAAFWFFPPLGVAALAYIAWRLARTRGGCAFRGEAFGRGGWEGRGRPQSVNTVFEERRRETLKALDEEAEAFDEFERRQRQARDREAFDRFMAGRDAPKDAEEPK